MSIRASIELFKKGVYFAYLIQLPYIPKLLKHVVIYTTEKKLWETHKWHSVLYNVSKMDIDTGLPHLGDKVLRIKADFGEIQKNPYTTEHKHPFDLKDAPYIMYDLYHKHALLVNGIQS